jgi:antitoxin component of MazEF toxin-antitoxin module
MLRDAGERWMGVEDYTISANRQILIAISRRYCHHDLFKEGAGEAKEGQDNEIDEEEDNPWDL